MKTKYGTAVAAIRTINPIEYSRTPEGGIEPMLHSSDLARAKGDIGEHVYYLKHDIRDACKAIDDRMEDIDKNISVMLKELNGLNEKVSEHENGTLDEKDFDSKEAVKRAKELKKEIAEQREEVKQTYENSEVEIKLTKGKLHFSKIKQYVDSNEIEALELFIDFKK